MTSSQIVLFVCVANAARSLMAEAIFNAHPPPGWIGLSAGTRPAAAVNPRTGPVLREVGLEVPAHPPAALTPDLFNQATRVITMGCLDDPSCPAWLKKLDTDDWELPNPAELDDEGFRSVRDQIIHRVVKLRRELEGDGNPGTVPAQGMTS